MQVKTLLAVLAVASALPLFAQPATEAVYFSTRFTETPLSGRGGGILGGAPTCFPAPAFGGGLVIESTVTNSPGLNYVVPGIDNATVPSSSPATTVVDFVELANFGQFNLVLGDMDGDGTPNESSNFRGVDAMYIPAPPPGRPANIHEIFVSSFADSSGSLGYLGTSITEADMVLMPAAANLYPNPHVPPTPVFFVREADWEVFFGLPAGSGGGIDVNAFTVDPQTGDIYASFNAFIAGVQLIATSGAAATSETIHPGDVIRIPAAAYTPTGPYGVVSAPVGGLAERVLTEADVTTLVSGAGGGITGVSRTDVFGLDVNPTGPSLLTANGFTIPELRFTVDNRGGSTSGAQNVSAPAIFSTAGGGTFAIVNNVLMDRAESAGMAPVSFNGNFYTGPMDALDIVTHDPGFDPTAQKALHMDSFPDSGLASLSPQRLVVYFSGSVPNALLLVFGRLDVLPAGGWVPRWSLGGGLDGHPDTYIDPLDQVDFNCVFAPTLWGSCQNGFAQSLFNGGVNPVATYVDPANGSDNGDGCFELNLPGFDPAGFGANPLLITFQIFDLSQGRLSTPYSLQFDLP